MYLSKEGKKLYKYHNLFEGSFLHFLEKTKKASDEKDIHDFRVNIKKLKGVIKLIDLIGEEFNTKEQFLPLKKLFKPAGKIRECQVNLKRLKYFSSYKEFYNIYKNSTKKCIKQNRKHFDIAIKEFSLRDLKKRNKEIKKYCKNLSQKNIYNKSYAFINERIHTINKLLFICNTVPDKIHEIRIQLKEISTILGLLNTINANGITQTTLVNLKLHEDEIGLWHDYTILRESIESNQNMFILKNIELKLDMLLLIKEIKIEEIKFTNKLNLFVSNIIRLIQPSLTYLSEMTEKLSQTSLP